MKRSKITEQGVMTIHIGSALLCVSLLVAGWFMGLGPLLTKSQQATSNTQEADHAKEQARLSKGRLQELTVELQAVRKQLDQQPVNLSPAATINALLAEIARWADEHQLALTQTNAGRPVALAYYDYVPISLAGEGGYNDLLGFLRKMRQDRGDLGVVSFNAKRLPKGGAIGFEIELAWYVLSDDAGTPQPPTAAVPTP